MGSIKNVAKTAKKEQLVTAYNQLFESKVSNFVALFFSSFSFVPVLCFNDFCRPILQRFKGTESEEELAEQVKAVKIEEKPKEVKAEVVDEVPAWR